jgi:hypothetical protein
MAAKLAKPEAVERRATGRPAKSLLARVLATSFRPGRYGPLLLAEPLPRPFRDRRRSDLWRELRAIQRRSQEEPEHVPHYARDFSRLVRSLHGSPAPGWYQEQLRRSYREMEAILASMTLPGEETPPA